MAYSTFTFLPLCTMDQELQHIQRANDVTRTWWASGQSADTEALLHATVSCGQTSWPPSWKCEIVSEIRLHYSMLIYLSEEQSCQISSRSDLKWWSLRLAWRASPQQEQEQEDEYRCGISCWSKDYV